MARRAPARGTTLIEMLVVVGLASVFLAAFWTFFRTATRYSVNLEARFRAVSDAQSALAVITRELHLARRVVHPAPGRTAKGVTLVGAAGDAVQFAFEPGPAQLPAAPASGSLVRFGLGGTRRVLMTRVLDLAARVPELPPGRDRRLVHLTLTVEGPGGRPLYLVTSARMRAQDLACPIDR